MLAKAAHKPHLLNSADQTFLQGERDQIEGVSTLPVMGRIVSAYFSIPISTTHLITLSRVQSETGF